MDSEMVSNRSVTLGVKCAHWSAIRLDVECLYWLVQLRRLGHKELAKRCIEALSTSDDIEFAAIKKIWGYRSKKTRLSMIQSLRRVANGE